MKSAAGEDPSSSKSKCQKFKGKLKPVGGTKKKVSEGTSTAGGGQNIKADKKKNLQQDNNRGSPMAIVKLYANMSDYQRQLIDGAGFGGLLNCSCSQVFPDICQWLLESFDADSSELVFPGRGRIPITEATVYRVMGIPRGSSIIKCEIDARSTFFMKNELGFDKCSQLKISDLSNILKNSANADDKYLRTWTLLAACSVVCPTFSTKVSPRLFPAVLDASKIGQLNWCDLVIRILKESCKPDAKKMFFKPCLTFLMILYLDSLNTGFKRISNRGCRVAVWTTKLVRKAIEKDTKPDGTFGALQLKPDFVGQDNMFFGHHLPLDSFINSHVPDNLGPQEQLKAKRAVQQLCSGFSKLVSKFLEDMYHPAPPNSDQQGGGNLLETDDEEDVASQEDTDMGEDGEDIGFDDDVTSEESHEEELNGDSENVVDEEEAGKGHDSVHQHKDSTVLYWATESSTDDVDNVPKT